mmetsp:Transcript_35202/g.49011  ORF Transcript_35202/g.49011 Transcript_35202/m.49011 type:complete len:92 (+) Transcript_35202:204-479(+)
MLFRGGSGDWNRHKVSRGHNIIRSESFRCFIDEKVHTWEPRCLTKPIGGIVRQKSSPTRPMCGRVLARTEVLDGFAQIVLHAMNNAGPRDY